MVNVIGLNQDFDLSWLIVMLWLLIGALAAVPAVYNWWLSRARYAILLEDTYAYPHLKFVLVSAGTQCKIIQEFPLNFVLETKEGFQFVADREKVQVK